jgi:cytochrome c
LVVVSRVGLALQVRGWAALAALVLGACGPAAPPAVDSAGEPPAAEPPTAAAFDVGPIKTAAEYLAEPRFAMADLERGALLSLACAACHGLRAGEPSTIGPGLHGVFGRSAASVPGFAYSDALRAAPLVWTPAAVEAWLAAPATFVPGTTMAFTGYRDPDDRRDLIAYLLNVTQ